MHIKSVCSLFATAKEKPKCHTGERKKQPAPRLLINLEGNFHVSLSRRSASMRGKKLRFANARASLFGNLSHPLCGRTRLFVVNGLFFFRFVAAPVLHSTTIRIRCVASHGTAQFFLSSLNAVLMFPHGGYTRIQIICCTVQNNIYYLWAQLLLRMDSRKPWL